MRFPTVFLITAALSLTTLFTQPAKAGMSVGIEDLEGVMKSNPRFDALFIDNLELAQTGTAMRLGRHFGAVAGAPVGPYQFQVRFASAPGADFPLLAIFHTELIFQDKDGKVVEDPLESGDATSVREKLVRVELLDTEELTKEEIAKALSELFEGKSGWE